MRGWDTSWAGGRSMGERPFFIVGSPRSGTTLLRFILSSHSRLYVPDETGFLPFLGRFDGRPLSQSEAQSLLRRIGRLNRLWRDMVPDLGAFYAGLPSPTLPVILDALFQQRIAPYQAARWGDKTPPYIQYIPQLLRLFPDAQFIHVVRDGRDATLSARKKWGDEKGYMDAYYLLKTWVRNVTAGQIAKQNLPADQFAEIRYETLAQTPEPVIRQLCAFLDEQFEPQMLAQGALAQKVGGGIDRHVEAQAAIHTGSIGRWRQALSPYEQKLADALAGDALQTFGYELAGLGEMTAVEKAKTAALAAKYHANNSLRTVLYKTGILTLNRNRR